MKGNRFAGSLSMSIGKVKGEGGWKPWIPLKTEESWSLPDYKVYSLSKKEWLIHMSIGLLLVMIISYLFYRRWLAFLLLIPLTYFYICNVRRKKQERRLQELSRQFKNGMLALSSALSAGYSIENAFHEAGSEMETVYGEDGMIVVEFHAICRKLQMNLPVEAALLDFAERSGLEDVQQLTAVFAIAKRSGGDLVRILKSSAETIGEKLRVAEEIVTLMAAKRLEQKIMSFMPLAILFYINTGNPGFTDPLYQGVQGVVIMTICLGVYGFALYLAERIMDVDM